MTGFLSFRLNCASVRVFDKMASALESLFHEAIEFFLEKQGKPERELKKEQYDAIRAIGRASCVANWIWKIANTSNATSDV